MQTFPANSLIGNGCRTEKPANPRRRASTAQLRAVGISISKRQVMRLLIDGQDDFLAENRDVLRAGLRTAAWILAATGAVVAASAGSLIRPFALGEPLRLLAARLLARPHTITMRAVHGLALVGAGLLLILDRDDVLRVAFDLAGYYLFAGSALELRINAGTGTQSLRLGPDLAMGERPQAVVPAQAWQTAESLGDWTLVGCTVAPGFEFAGFELAPKGWSPG